MDSVDTLLQSLSLEEKVGQLFMLAFEGTELDDARVLLAEHYVGGVYLSSDNLPTLDEGVALVQALHGFAAQTPHRLPIIAGCDEEGAWAVLTEAMTPGPGNMALGATDMYVADADSPATPDVPGHTRAMYGVLGRQLRALGIDADLAPVADVNSNPSNPIIGTRSFGENPRRVAAAVRAGVEGLHEAGAISCAKHFPGHGDTHGDSHRGIPTVDRPWEEIARTDLVPFKAAIEAGVDIVMTAHIMYPARDPEHPATLSPTILQGVLRDELGFSGVVLSDSFNMGAVKRHYAPQEAVVDAILAGVDMILLAEERYGAQDSGLRVHYLQDQIGLLAAVLAAVRDGRLPAARLDDALRRILTLKLRYGLFERRPADVATAAEVLGRAENTATALAAARAACVVVQDRAGLVPLAMAGDGEGLVVVSAVAPEARERMRHMRGIGPNVAREPLAVAREEISRRAPGARLLTIAGEDEVAACAATIGRDDVRAVVVITENYPLPGLDFPTGLQVQAVQALCASGKPVVVVGLRDPYELAQFPQVDAYVSALGYDASCVRAAVEVLFGETKATGILPVTIPGVAREGTRSL